MASRPNPIASLSQSLMLLAASRGVPLDGLLRAAGLDGDALLAPEARVSESAVLASLRMMERLRPTENVALALAERLPIALFGQLNWFIGRSPDLGALADQLERHSDLIAARLTYELRCSRDEAAVIQHHPLDDEDGGLGAELGFACGLRGGARGSSTNSKSPKSSGHPSCCCTLASV